MMTIYYRQASDILLIVSPPASTSLTVNENVHLPLVSEVVSDGRPSLSRHVISALIGDSNGTSRHKCGRRCQAGH